MADKITMKDIAEKANVSVGTVDRVLHNRPNVSSSAREKIEQAIREMNYKPNLFASALANSRAYRFHVIIPSHDSEAYWEEIEEGVMKSADTRREFNVSVCIMHYDRYDDNSFTSVCEESLRQQPDGVVLTPASAEIAQTFADELHAKNIPFVLLDSYMPSLQPLSFWGQDSTRSGFFAARMLMLVAAEQKNIMLFKIVKDGKVTTRQQADRERGFKQYMHENFPDVRISELLMPLRNINKNHDRIITTFLSKNPDVHHCITFNSKAHIIGNYLLRHNIKDIQIMGYDMVKKNADCLRQGSISFLIAQHGYQQGYNCIETLFRCIVMRMSVSPINYMPIELLAKENVDYYRRTQL